MRQYIRHPSDIPIDYDLEDVVGETREHIKNVSQGGICFLSRIPIDPGATIHIKIPIRKPIFEADGTVVWCSKVKEHYEVGVSLVNQQAEFGIRMVEQICHIEHYKKDVLKKEGRVLTGEEAAVEWIEKYASQFPR